MPDLQALKQAVVSRDMIALMGMARASRQSATPRLEGEQVTLKVCKDDNLDSILAALEGRENLAFVVLQPEEEKPAGISWLLPVAVLAICKPEVMVVMPEESWRSDTLELAALFCAVQQTAPKGEAVAC